MTLIQQLILKVGLTFLSGIVVFAVFLYLAAGRKKSVGGGVYAAFIATLLLFGGLQLVHSGLIEGIPDRVLKVLPFAAYLSMTFVLFKAIDLLFIEDYLIDKKRYYIPDLIRLVIMAASLAVAVLILLRTVLGINVLALIAVPTVATAVIGFALRDTIARVVAGMVLGNLMHIGDWVTVMGKEGVVTNLTLGYLTITTREDDAVMLPNNSVIAEEILNHSRPTPLHASTVILEVNYAHPPLDVRNVLIEAARGVPGVAAHPEPQCFIHACQESGIAYRLRFWLEDFAHRDHIEGEVLTYAWYALKRHGMEIPYPQRVVHTPQPVDTAKIREEELEWIRQYLHKVDFLRVLSEEELGRLSERTERRIYLPGETMVRQGDAGDELFILVDGEAAVLVQTGERSTAVATLTGGKFFGEMSLLTGEPRTATVKAQIQVTVLVLGKEAFGRLLSSNPALVDQFSEILVTRQAELAAKRAEAEQADAEEQKKKKRSLSDRIRSFFRLKRS